MHGSIAKTAFVTKTDQYEFLRLRFGLKNAVATFHWLMNSTLWKFIGKFCFIYIDDIVIYHTNVQEHYGHLRQLFAELEAPCLTLNLKKCNLLQKCLFFSWTCCLRGGSEDGPSKVKAIKKLPHSQGSEGSSWIFLHFLGLVAWYNCFIPHFSKQAAPFHALKKEEARWK